MELGDIPQELFDFCIFTYIDFKDVVRLALTCKDMHTRISRIRYEKQVIYTHRMKAWFGNLRNIKIYPSEFYVSMYSTSDFLFLHGMFSCTVLDLSWTSITDVSMLRNVHTLNLCDTPITNVSPFGFFSY